MVKIANGVDVGCLPLGCGGLIAAFIGLLIIGKCSDAAPARSAAADTSRLPVLTDTTPAADTAAFREERVALKALRKTIDSVTGQTTYTHPNSPKFVNSRTAVKPYLIDTGKRLVMRLQVTYVADDWLFIRNYAVKTDSGYYDWTPESYGADAVDRDNAAGGIWEWWDVDATPYLDALRDIAHSKRTVIRFTGKQYHRDWRVPPSDREAIRQLLLAQLAPRP